MDTRCLSTCKHKSISIKEELLRFKSVRNIIHRINKLTLKKVHNEQIPGKAKGVDGVTKDEYAKNINYRLERLIERMKRFRYRPKPVRRTYILKLNGKRRPLGILAYEDRLVQGAMALVLTEIYELIFLDCSYGFRPGRGCHDAVKDINQTIMFDKVNWVLEADIKGFFDHVDHTWMMKFLEHVIKDKAFLRYVGRFLKAGIMEDGQFRESIEGTPQGGIISPILANVYLHYVLDLWYTYRIKPELKGKSHYVRYADDFIILFEHEEDARMVMENLKERLGKFSLEVAEDKTRILPFGRQEGTKETFDFLGFTFYNTKTRKGKYRVGLRTCLKKLKAKMAAVKQWIHQNMHIEVEELLKSLNLKYKGHCQYYGVNGNFRALWKFKAYICNITYKTLRRRSQVGKIKWDRFIELWDQFISKPRIMVNIWY